MRNMQEPRRGQKPHAKVLGALTIDDELSTLMPVVLPKEECDLTAVPQNGRILFNNTAVSSHSAFGQNDRHQRGVVFILDVDADRSVSLSSVHVLQQGRTVDINIELSCMAGGPRTFTCGYGVTLQSTRNLRVWLSAPRCKAGRNHAGWRTKPHAKVQGALAMDDNSTRMSNVLPKAECDLTAVLQNDHILKREQDATVLKHCRQAAFFLR